MGLRWVRHTCFCFSFVITNWSWMKAVLVHSRDLSQYIDTNWLEIVFILCIFHAVKPATCVSELAEFYRDSCRRHNAQPIESIMKHLDTLDLNSNTRRPVLNLREQNLTAESCEALEEVLKRVSHMHHTTNTWDHIHLSVIIHANKQEKNE